MTALTREDVIYKHPVTQDMYSHEKWKYADKRCQELALKIADELKRIRNEYMLSESCNIIMLHHKQASEIDDIIKVLRSAQGEKKE